MQEPVTGDIAHRCDNAGIQDTATIAKESSRPSPGPHLTPAIGYLIPRPPVLSRVLTPLVHVVPVSYVRLPSRVLRGYKASHGAVISIDSAAVVPAHGRTARSTE